MEVTLAEAASRLGVTVRQAQRLARSGRLDVVRYVGRSALVDDASIVTITRQRRTSGRRWDAATAWAAIELLSVGVTERVDPVRGARLARSLRVVDVRELARLVSARARPIRCDQAIGTRAQLLGELQVTGRSALGDPVTAASMNLTEGESPAIEGYVQQHRLAHVVDRFGLEPSAEGQVFLLVTRHHPVDSPVTTALDVYERGSTREHAAAARFLGGVLEDVRKR